MRGLRKITFTGPDDLTQPDNLFHLSKEYSFIEWGILIAPKNYGRFRFPSMDWINELYKKWLENGKIGNFSLHLCGKYVEDILQGNDDVKYELGRAWKMFQRVQINTHGRTHLASERLGEMLMYEDSNKSFIFQYDNKNPYALISAIMGGAHNVSALFDLSGGKGDLPRTWPKPIPGMDCGYAGGLGPDNLKKQLQLIMSVSDNLACWVDMETRVRSNGDKIFDLTKVQKCIDIFKKETGL